MNFHTNNIQNKNTLFLLFTVLFLNVSTNIFSFPSLSPWKFLDNKFCASLGNQDASTQYQETIREFLSNFDTKNPQTIPIRKMSSEAAQLYNTPGVIRPTGIWLNEDSFFNGQISSQQIYMLANLSACHAYSNTKLATLACIKYVIDKLPTTSPLIKIMSNTLILKQIYQRVQQPKAITKIDIITDATLLTAIHWVPSLLYDALKHGVAEASKKIIQQTDLATANMLCEYGYTQVVEDIIQQLDQNIMQGKATGRLHPRTQEMRDSLQECVCQWKDETDEVNEIDEVNEDL